MRFWNSLVAQEVAAVVSALVLAIGAVIEYWSKIKLLTLLALKWILGRSTPFDRCTFRKLFIHSVGPILVVLGIAGEFVFEGRTFVLGYRQEQQSETAVTSLREKASVNERDAGQLRKDAEGLKEKAAAEELARIQLQKEIQPRTLTLEQRKALAEKLGKFAFGFKGRKVKLVSQVGDAEGIVFTVEIHDILHRAEIEVDTTGVARQEWIGTIYFGAKITGPNGDAEFIKTLLNGLRDGIGNDGIDAEASPKYGETIVTIGAKPILGLPKEWIRKTPP